MISNAFPNAAPAEPDPMFQILMLVGFIAIFYFLLWRPWQKRAKSTGTLSKLVLVINSHGRWSYG